MKTNQVETDDDFVDDCYEKITTVVKTIKPFVIAHKAALVIASVTLIGVLLIMLSFNRYEYVQVNQALYKADRLTGRVWQRRIGNGGVLYFEPILSKEEFRANEQK